MLTPRNRRLGLVPLIFTIFCCVSGGPFGLEEVVSLSGPGAAILLILITPIVWALPVALKTMELTSAIPEEGGYYVWVKRAMGPFAGFLCAWWTWLYAIVDIALYPVLFAAYLGALLKMTMGIDPFEGNPQLAWGTALGVLVVFTVLNIRGIRAVGTGSIVLTLLLMLPFVPMVAIAIWRFVTEPVSVGQPFVPAGMNAQDALSAGLYTVMWNYLGWDSLSTVAGEVEEPERNFPLAIGLCMGVITLAYLLPVLAGLVGTPDSAQWGDGSWPVIAGNLGGPWLAVAMAIAGLFSAAALFSATLLANSRLPFVLAADGLFPKVLTRLHPKYGTPWLAILVCSGVCAILCQQSFQDLLKINVVLYGAALIPETVALMLLRIKEPNLPRPYRIPGGWPMLWFILLAPIAILAFAVFMDLGEAGREALGEAAGNPWLEGLKVQWLTWAALASGPILYPLIRAWHRKRGTR